MKFDNQKTSILTYNHLHRKTQDLLLLLKVSGYTEVEVLAYPWRDRDNLTPLIPHRMFEPIEVEINELCRTLGFQYRNIIDYSELHQSEQIYLIAGAGILPRKFVENNMVINSHPGYLPHVRGLDALKWAIVEGLPIGVTTHKVDEKPDAGYLIKQEILNPYDWETFHGFAYRIFMLEIKMLVDAIEDVKTSDLVAINVSNYQSHKRMPARTEMKLLSCFNRIK